MKQIAFFDLDRTILAMNTGYAFGLAARSKGLMGKKDLVRAGFMMVLYKLKIISPAKIISGMGKWLKGLDRETVTATGRLAAEKYLVKSVYPAFYSELQRHRNAGASTAILSSAISEICEPLAEALGIEYVVCSVMECSNGVYSGLPEGDYCYGKEKKSKMIEFCKARGFLLSDSWYYADSYSDIPALETAGSSVCINPGRKLKKEARKRVWRIEKWKMK